MKRPGQRALSALAVVTILFGMLAAAAPRIAQAEPVANDPFQRTWQRTDQPVASGAVSRTWMWGPEPFTGSLREDYAEFPGGKREVQYFDKSRMEITHPDGDQNSVWYVTNGLLVMELVTGRMQTGDSQFVERSPARVNVAGDADDRDGPTYATFAQLLDDTAGNAQDALKTGVRRDGSVYVDERFAGWGVGASHFVAETNHWVADPFWAFMNARGPVFEGGAVVDDQLFESPFYATGLPIVDPYWATVKVGGEPRDVLMQCFERRCLTFTPENPAEWQVEAGNVGQHYYRWRYQDAPAGPSAQANALAAAVAGAADDDARYAALLDVMEALGIGVYANDGTPIVRGAERGAGDFYLYETEMRLMAAAVGRGDTRSVEDIARFLNELPYLDGGATVAADQLREVLVEGAQAAQADPGSAASLPALIARQLGLTHGAPYDLFADVSLANLQLDALQQFLVISDLLLPTIAEAGPVAAGSTNVEQATNGVLKMTAVESDNPCDADVGVGVKEGWSGGKWFLGFVKKIGNPVKIAAVAIDGIHGSVLAYSVLVYALDQELSTHYGHNGEGQELHFRIKTEMVDELPENVIKCGWLLGVEFPKKGPIREVGMIWAENGLEEHGTIVCEDFCKKTDVNGIATLIFKPKREVAPGAGWLVEQRGQLKGISMYQSRLKNALGSVNQIITPKLATIDWKVEYHEVPAYKIFIDVEYEGSWAVASGDSIWTHQGSGEMSFYVILPASMVHYPLEAGQATYGGSGSGSSVTTQEPVIENCQNTWAGSFSDVSPHVELADHPEAPGEFSRWVRVVLKVPPHQLWSGCETGSKQFDTFYAGLAAQPMFDVTVREEQHFTMGNQQLCPVFDDATNGAGISCEASAEWTVRVEFAEPPS